MADTIVQKSGTDMVYLVPNADDSWKTVITVTPPAPAAAVLSAEEDYPVEVYYRRTDLNGSGTIEMDHCQNREELTRSLDWIGQCGHLILSFWTFQHDMPMENALTEILDKAYERGYKQRQQVLLEIEEDTECRSLNALINEAHAKTPTMPSSEPPDRSPEL